MIETHEDWEHVKTVAELQSGPSLQHAVDTIEALRKVAKAAQFAKYMAAAGFDTALNQELDKLRVALDEIPDWIAEDDR